MRRHDPKCRLVCLDARSIGAAVGHLLPENCVVVDEGGMSGAGSYFQTQGAPAHDWLILSGGSIGYGLPAAIGAAVACPDRRVVSLQADGAGMYTVQALWTQVREQLDITTVVFANQKYAILQIEFERVGAHDPGPKAMSMLDLSNPELTWTKLAEGMGMPAWRVTTAEEFHKALGAALQQKGPSLIEAMI